MTSLLVKNAAVLATMDDAGSELSGGSLYAENGWITHVGQSGGSALNSRQRHRCDRHGGHAGL